MRNCIITCIFALVCVSAFCYYDTERTDYVDFLTANDICIFRDQFYGDHTQWQSMNKAALKLKWFGVSGEYRYFKLIPDNDNQSGEFKDSAVGVGAGLPNPDLFRLYATYYIRTREYAGTSRDYFSLCTEMAKRSYSLNMSSEFMLRYSYYNYENLVYPPINDKVPDLYEGDIAWTNPQEDIQVKAFVSSVTQPWLEPLQDAGLAPDDRPLLLVEDTAIAFYAHLRYTDYSGSHAPNQYRAKAILPMNMSRYFGLDLAYKNTQFGRSDPLRMHEGTVSLRPTFLAFNGFRLTGLADTQFHYSSSDEDSGDSFYMLNVGGAASYLFEKHVALYAQYLNRNIWDLTNDASSFDHQDFAISAGLAIRY